MEPAQMERTPFADLDRQPREMTAMLLAALETMGRHPEIRRVRRTAMDALHPADGWRVLDAGSGAGDVARWIATEVGPTGEVIALDYSAATIAAAIERHDGSNVRYTTGDVSSIDLPSASVDGVWCERVLQHVEDADRAIAELVRVTRPGGRVCLIDTDWSSLAFDGVPARLAGTVVADMHGRLTPKQVDMGRTLRRRLVGLGLEDISATPVTCVFGDPASAAVVLPMVNPMVPEQAWRSAPGVREKWFAQVDEAGARGDFLAILTIWVVAGTTGSKA
ncbi:methyltransferase domain-containing protein [Actinoplanes bogorensis]|uniref:Methyltransferase domain-containing protein n=1 Tax=Paractinoplanes bogorensis TaxID=1610840 RepID=A0ABS5YH87_9ACTN|nr:methyltransferase domain-containing protein [Actinoplanes bogorensis]MBU2662762.1 methyltransferase domain-containing protein [Actinoplanes bogorensis]